VRKLYADTLIAAGVVTKEEADALAAAAYQALADAHSELKDSLAHPAHDTGEHQLDRTAAPSRRPSWRRAAALLNEQLLKLPEDFHLHRKLKPQLEKRRVALDEGTIEWAQAEELAYASLLLQGVPIRLTGQDVERGTFSQRHLVFHDSENGTASRRCTAARRHRAIRAAQQPAVGGRLPRLRVRVQHAGA